VWQGGKEKRREGGRKDRLMGRGKGRRSGDGGNGPLGKWRAGSMVVFIGE